MRDLKTQIRQTFGLTGNQLKILALLAMTVDHVGMIFFPRLSFLRWIGRLAMPIFAWMIAEGCRYTRNRGRYLLGIAALGLVCQAVLGVAVGSYYQGILVVFSLSVAMIYLIDALKNKIWGIAICVLALSGMFWLTELLPPRVPLWDFAFDYGFCGVMLPVAFYVGRNTRQKLLLGLVLLVPLAVRNGFDQWFGLLSLPLLALYNGQRGKYRMKYLFYIYYPLHLALLYALALWV